MIYVCLQACKYGYKAGCRRIIGLDGCFLKGYFGGYLFATVGIDANNDIYPIAYVAIESENQASWCWKVARASTIRDFEDGMAELKNINKYAYDWLKGKNSAHWCFPSHVGGERHQVECGLGSQCVMDLVENSCSCRNWEITDIPCIHTVIVIHLKYKNPKTYVDNYYTKETQFSIYFNFIKPVRGLKQWEPVLDMLPILPPLIKRPLGRPNMRRKEVDEPQTTANLTKK
ncbi:hypothetical protein Gogos_010519 [Gossypium gossypioides]|uniref:SWIM-type domain-containing protein n=1 Tax=Gossypium gossypioides TaxID=34282 RepID=A0A7J9BLF6_GOSGO|nr:hypothetical protein [Gossypium gossypioides]